MVRNALEGLLRRMSVDVHRLLILVLLIGLGGGSPVLGQDPDAPEDNVLIGGIQQNGGYGAPTIALTAVNGERAILVGGQGGWVINRHFVIGGAGRALATPQDATLDGEAVDLEMGYGGVLFEYIGAPSRLVHYGGEVLIGAGDARFVDDARSDDQFDGDALAQTSFFASEIGGRLELNVTTFFRVGLSGGYRLIVGNDLQGISDADLGGVYGQVSFRFGSF